MRIVMALIGALCIVLGIGIMEHAQSAIHEIEAGILFLMFVVAFASVGIMDAIEKQTTYLGKVYKYETIRRGDGKEG